VLKIVPANSESTFTPTRFGEELVTPLSVGTHL
jgi:hypothetical protein